MTRHRPVKGYPHLAGPDNPLWDDLRVPLTRATTGANNPTLTSFRDGLMMYAFSATSLNQIYFDSQLPHAWREGSGIRPHIHWSPGNSSNTGVVRWGLEYSWANAVNPPGNVWGASQTIYVEQAAGGTPYQQQIAEFGELSGVGKRLSSVLVCRLFRDAAHVNDTFTGACFGVSFDFHIQIEEMGSAQEYPGAPA